MFHMKKVPCTKQFSICLGLVLLFIYYSSFIGKDTSFKRDGSLDEIKYRSKGPLNPNDSSLILYIQTKYLQPPSTEDYNLSKSLEYQVSSKALTWAFIHEKLKILFKNEPPGFFVEAGALDGEFISNTLWLEKEKGWKGLLIEPDPISYSVLLKKNRKAWVANSCLATSPYPQEAVFVTNNLSKDKMDKLGSESWVFRSHTYEFEKGLEMMDNRGFFKTYVSVQCFPLESFLLALNASVVDFLSLDIQGGEWAVLKQFPWDRIKLRAMAVEYIKGNNYGKTDPDFVAFMDDKGFNLIGTSSVPDYLYVSKNDALFSLYKQTLKN